MCAGGPPKPRQPIRPHSRATVASDGRATAPRRVGASTHRRLTPPADASPILLEMVPLVEYPPSVVLIVTDGDDVLLVRQVRPGAGGPVVELPAGKCEPGETVMAAAARELAEECGLAATGWRELGSFWAAPGYSTERVTVLAARAGEAASAPADDDEEIAVLRVPLAEAELAVEDAGSLAALALLRRTA